MILKKNLESHSSGKKKKIDCYCWVSRNEIPEERRHIVYSIHGKRIFNEIISQPIQLKDGIWNRVFCLVNVSHLAKHIRTDKESFLNNWETNQTKQAVQKFFIEFLTEQGLTAKDNSSKFQTNEIVNEFTKELDALLKTKAFKDLNPFLNPRKRMALQPNEDGDVVLSEVSGDVVGGDGDGGTGSGRDHEHGEGTGFVEDEEGDTVGKRVEKRSKGIRIILTEEFPDEKEEAWVDLPRGAIVLNILHPFYITMQNSDRFGKFEKFNIRRLLIESLIKFKNDELKEEWDPIKTLNTYRDLLHKTWRG